MKNLKRILCLLLAMALVFAFVGCGEKETTSTVDDDWAIEVEGGEVQGDSQATSGSNSGSGNQLTAKPTKDADSLSWKELLAQMPKNLRGSTIKVASWNPIKDVTGAQKVIDSFTKETGIKVDWEEIDYENYETTIAAYINAGKSPDVIRYQHSTAAKMQVAQDLKTATGYDFSGDIWDKSTRDAFTVKGKVYGINLKNTFNMQPQVMFYSAKNIKNNNMEDPYTLWKQGKWTYNKFKEMCLQYLEKSGSTAAWMSSYQLDYLQWQGLDLVTYDGKQYKSNLSDPKIVTAIQEVCNNRASSIMATTMREHDKLEDDTYLFFSGNIIAARRTDFHFTTIKSEGNLRCVPLPTIQGVTNWVPMHESEAYGIPKGAKNPAAVYYYLRYYLNADNYDAKMFFADEQILETYNWCMAQKNKFHYIGNTFDMADYTRSGTAAQVKTQLDKIAPTVNAYVKNANGIIAKF